MEFSQERIMEWVVMPSAMGSSQPGDQTQASHIAGRFSPYDPPGKPQESRELPIFIGLFVLMGGKNSLYILDTSPFSDMFYKYLCTVCRKRQWHPTPVLLPGKSHGWMGHWGLETTEQLHFHFSLSYIGEGNGNPLQCSCLENPRDRGASWAAVYGVTQSWKRLKWLSSSSMHSLWIPFLKMVSFESRKF